MRLGKFSGVVCWFSGGRDSAVACYIAKRVAEARGWDFRLVHIYTRTPRPREVDEYIQEYAKWLGEELDIIMPERSFAEYAARYKRWPVLWYDRDKYHYGRWCYFELKYNVIVHFLRSDPTALNALHVFAIRAEESLFREREYNSVFGVKCYEKDLCVRYWLPLLRVDSLTLQRLVKTFGVPESPVWRKLGYSGECTCLAGMPMRTLIRLAANYPEVMEELAVIDDIIQAGRYKAPSYPAPLIDKRLTLRQWWEQLKRQPRLDDYLDNYEGKGCQGSCIL
jgi:3'-phosphoadenosine 5'-phosphosulfate sulfotransferase (PAPS reductase)/FAD synthetase